MKKLMLVVLSLMLLPVFSFAQNIPHWNQINAAYEGRKAQNKKAAQPAAGTMIAATVGPVVDTTGFHETMQKALEKSVADMRFSFKELLFGKFELEAFGQKYSYNEEVKKALEETVGTSLEGLPLVYNLGQYATVAHHWNDGEMEFYNLYHVAVQQGDYVNYYEITVGEYKGYTERSVVSTKQMNVSTASGEVASHRELLPYAQYKESFEQEKTGKDGSLDIIKVVVFDNYK